MTAFLVTGANGFVGASLLKHLLSSGHRVTAVSRTPLSIMHENLSVLHIDLRSYEKLDEVRADVLIHLAWTASMGVDRENLDLQLQNLVIAENAVRLAKDVGAKRFIGIGTITERELDHVKLSPGNSPGPAFMYGMMKSTARELTAYRAAQAGLEHIWLRLGNTYGLGDTTGRFLINTIEKMLKGEDLSFSAGTQNYEFIYMSDCVRAIELASLNGVAGRSYYVGAGDVRSLREFVKAIAEVTETSSNLSFGNAAAGVSLPLEDFSISALSCDTGYVPEVLFEDGVQAVVQDLKNGSGFC